MSVKISFSVRGGQTEERDIKQVRPAFMLMGINYGGEKEEGFGSGQGVIQSQGFRGSKGQ